MNNPLDKNRHYDYDPSREYCDSLPGMIWQDSWMDGPDERFHLVGMTQDQVDAVMREHIFKVWWLFQPSTYTLGGRLKLAFHFLFRNSTK